MTNKKYCPIGIFDSGYGGLTIFKEIISLLPGYDFVYLGDNARTPYGTRSYDIVYQYTLEAVNTLFNLGCWLIILACNTASSKALRTIQQNDLPKINPEKRVLGVLRPSVEIINKFTRSNHIGIFGTEGTINSESYILEIKKLYPYIQVNQEACPMWVPLVENNEYNSEGADYFIKKHINNILLKDNKIDAIILGCTHYPFLMPKIKKFLPHKIEIISQDKIVAESLKNYLNRHPELEEKITTNGQRRFFTTGSPEMFSERAGLFLDEKIYAEKIIFK
ncbi:MAG: glutamate racemase [Bacteroidales bacterium]|nr:glutamate racemase [Bacteroidales bacterium]